MNKLCTAYLAITLLALALAACSANASLPAPVGPAALDPHRVPHTGPSVSFLYFFTGWPLDGSQPVSALVPGPKGILYGISSTGGNVTSGPCYQYAHKYSAYPSYGTIYQIDSTGYESLVYSFCKSGTATGFMPVSSPAYVGGSLYGTTDGGGANGVGMVYAATPGRSLRFPYSLPAPPYQFVSDYPAPSLTYIGGTLYGVAPEGGLQSGNCASHYGCGIVFAMTLSGALHVLYEFRGGLDGAVPVTSLAYFNGELYGRALYGGSSTLCQGSGCGTIFAISPAGKERTVYRFTSSYPYDDAVSALTPLGNALYGTTTHGGSKASGTVFALSATGVFHTIHTFGTTTTDGSNPSGLTAYNSMLYGLTQNGGAYGNGTIYKITPAGKETILYAFQRGYGGPAGTLTAANGGLYGVAPKSGLDFQGEIFELIP